MPLVANREVGTDRGRPSLPRQLGDLRELDDQRCPVEINRIDADRTFADERSAHSIPRLALPFQKELGIEMPLEIERSHRQHRHCIPQTASCHRPGRRPRLASRPSILVGVARAVELPGELKGAAVDLAAEALDHDPLAFAKALAIDVLQMQTGFRSFVDQVHRPGFEI